MVMKLIDGIDLASHLEDKGIIRSFRASINREIFVTSAEIELKN